MGENKSPCRAMYFTSGGADLTLFLSLDKSQYYGDVVNDCMGVKTNNLIYLVQLLWGCIKCL